MPLLSNQDMSLVMRGKLCRSCVHSCMSHGSETWPVKNENKLTVQWAEIRMIRWMCRVKLPDRFVCSELRERLGIDDIIAVVYSNVGYDGMGMF